MSVIAVFKLHGKLLSVLSPGKDLLPLQNRTHHVVVCFLEESAALGWSVSAPRKGFGSLVDVFRLNYFLIFHLCSCLLVCFARFFPTIVISSDGTGRLFRIFFSSSLGSFVSTNPWTWVLPWHCFHLQSFGIGVCRSCYEVLICELPGMDLRALFAVLDLKESLPPVK